MNIGWDIGIKNLSYCILTDKKEIVEWDIIDIADTESYFCCHSIKNKNKLCGKNAKKINIQTNQLYCNIHSKKKDNLKDLFICFECNNKAKKKDKENNFYCNKHSKDKHNLYNINISKNDINTLGNKLIQKLDQKESIINVKNIVIENQPALKNPTMKTIQIILYTYYLIKKKNDNYNITMVAASSKLKFNFSNNDILEIKKIKNKYQKNKKLSIEYCKYLIKDNSKWFSYFTDFKKKDDLSDSFLLIYYKLNNI